MKYSFIILFLTTFFLACSSSQNTINKNTVKASKVDKIINNANNYLGVSYKFGGTTTKGIDCSGVIYVAFKQENIFLPRISRDMAKKGNPISLSNAKKGDLVFFRTNKNSRKINHVGLIVSIKNGIIYFLHATTSKGVIISSLSQKYWKNAFVKAVNLL